MHSFFMQSTTFSNSHMSLSLLPLVKESHVRSYVKVGSVAKLGAQPMILDCDDDGVVVVEVFSAFS